MNSIKNKNKLSALGLIISLVSITPLFLNNSINGMTPVERYHKALELEKKNREKELEKAKQQKIEEIEKLIQKSKKMPMPQIENIPLQEKEKEPTTSITTTTEEPTTSEGKKPSFRLPPGTWKEAKRLPTKEERRELGRQRKVELKRQKEERESEQKANVLISKINELYDRVYSNSNVIFEGINEKEEREFATLLNEIFDFTTYDIHVYWRSPKYYEFQAIEPQEEMQRSLDQKAAYINAMHTLKELTTWLNKEIFFFIKKQGKADEIITDLRYKFDQSKKSIAWIINPKEHFEESESETRALKVYTAWLQALTKAYQKVIVQLSSSKLAK